MPGKAYLDQQAGDNRVDRLCCRCSSGEDQQALRDCNQQHQYAEMSIPIRRQYCLWPHPLLSCALAALVFWQSVTAQYNESIFSFDNSYPTVWWAVSGADRPTLANNAVRLRQDTIDRPLFARSVIVSLASGQRNEVGSQTHTAAAFPTGQSDWCLQEQPIPTLVLE